MAAKQRPSADETRSRILEAAQQIFLEKGFDGSLIKDIAAMAQVNSNLIFHHFINKETLWIKVRESLFKQYNITPSYDFSSVHRFFKSFLDHRFEVYSNPNVTKFLQWQQLTEHNSSLLTNELVQWQGYIQSFQQQGEIRADIDKLHIIIFLHTSSSALFLQHLITFNDEQKLCYKNMLWELYCSYFVNTNNNIKNA